MKIDQAAIYGGDNGAMSCGAHLSKSTAATGRDLSGRRIRRLTQHDIDEHRTVMSLLFERQFTEPLCETCRRAAKEAA